jgi:hypothetical protein
MADTTSTTRVTLERAGLADTRAEVLWAAIALHTEATSFNTYERFVAALLSGDSDDLLETREPRALRELREGRPVPGADMYDILKRATETFLLLFGGVWVLDDDDSFPTLNLGVFESRENLGEKIEGAARIEAPLDDGERGGRRDRGDRHGSVLRRLFQDVLFPRRRTRTSELRAAETRESVLYDADAEMRLTHTDMAFSELRSKLGVYLRDPDNNYLDSVLSRAYAEGTASVPATSPLLAGAMGPFLLELIWSYWHEEAMLVQTMNALLLRFQNVRRPGRTDPLADLELDPLRPLAGVLWGYLQDEHNRLSLTRRALEYDHEYGLRISGRAVRRIGTADSRSRFLPAFHNLLRQCALFFREDNDTTVIADAFGLMNALRELHLVLAEGAHNQFRDLPWTARVEMLMQQWILAQPEVGEFLRGRPMVPYRERWMARVDAMKKLQGWGDVSTVHFGDLARSGERLLLSVRYGNWSAITDQEQARAWARYWKPEIQNYVHAYQAVTGVNITDETVLSGPRGARDLPPSYHLSRRERALKARW